MTDEPDQTPPPLGENSELTPSESAAATPGAVAIGQGKLSVNDDKTFGMLSHLLGAFTSFVGPLVIWMIKREESPFVNDQGRESLNFQITILIGYVACFVIGWIPFAGCLSALLAPAIAVVSLIFSILGCLEANKGIAYRYPFNIRLVN
jgi:hypothetical protein